MSQLSNISSEFSQEPDENRRRLPLIGGAILFVMVLLLAISNSLSAAEDEVQAADLSGSTKAISTSSTVPGATVQYTIVVSNSGTLVGDSTTVYLTDTLPSDMSFVTETIQSDAPAYDFLVNGQVMTWTTVIPANTAYTIMYDVNISDTVAPGTYLTNTAQIGYDSTTIVREAGTLVTNTFKILMPIGSKSIPAPTVSSTRPNSGNSWTVTWNNLGVAKYEIQESQSKDFSSSPIVDTGASTSYNVTKSPSPSNSYFYRVRGVTANGRNGSWSAPLEVVGAYFDDFSSDTTNWDVRRTTFKEEVTSFYENPAEGWFILRVEDSWDWGIASPLAKAPQPPYAIEYRMQPANLGNLVSQGVVFGSDFPGPTCDPIKTITGFDNIYKHTNCFNFFYATNTIWYGKLKLQMERIDALIWCGNCGGSPMKRFGDVFTASDPIPNTDSNGFNVWRIEVRSSGIKFFANGQQYFTYGDTRHINNPYFGIFATTDEYSNSTARFDYFKITPLDS